ncbi:heavy-metal-associated domain-containing protein [Candidatus Peregrinibacteria bacterium]|nr:heavy-metal-associated domain-containing protein [Candidatus Peregrinibacteria bacterium]
MQTSHFNLIGLTCDACVRLIQKRLGKIEGVQSVAVDSTGATTLSAPREISNEEVKTALAGTAYAISNR